MFLETLTAASLGVLAEGAFTDVARAQNKPKASTHSTDQGAFETAQIEVSGNATFIRRYGNGPAILMVHGFPRKGRWAFGGNGLHARKGKR